MTTQLGVIATKRRYKLRVSYQDIPKDSAAMALLDNVRQSIAMVSKFGETALGVRDPIKDEWIKAPTRQGTKALSMLEATGERWAADHVKAGRELPASFSAPLQADGFAHYGADIFIAEFLQAAHAMAAIVEKSQRPPAKRGVEGRAVNSQHSPTQWLIGHSLPAIYSHTFKLPFL